MLKFAAPALALCLALPAHAQGLALAPADPQPSAAALAEGLAVSYAYPSQIRTLADAARALEKAKPGEPLIGLSYLDGSDGEITLTSDSAHKVAAAISGFIRFDAPGSYALEVISNDGVEVTIGGQQVAFFDGIHGCESAGVTQVQVPQAGWYPLQATYFQRKGSACLLMDWTPPGGEMEPVPDEAFAYRR